MTPSEHEVREQWFRAYAQQQRRERLLWLATWAFAGTVAALALAAVLGFPY